MTTFTQSLLGIVTSDFVTKVSALLGEDEAKVEVAAKSTLSSIIDRLSHEGSNSMLELLFLNVANDRALNKINFFSGSLDEETKGLSGELVAALFGDKTEDAVNLIAAQSGISKEHSSQLITRISLLVAGVVGHKLQSGLGLNSLLGSLASVKAQMDVPSLSPEPKIVFPWFKVLIPVALVLLSIFLMLGNNDKKTTVQMAIIDHPNIPTQQVQIEDIAITQSVDNALEQMINAEALQSLIDIKLPDGSIVLGFKSGTEERLLEFLQSNDYVLMTNDELKQYWFDFDNINFEFGSGTKITKESEMQIENIAALLNSFNESWIKLGAYTDAKGDAAFNLKLSQERANTIKNLLIKAGVSATRIIGAEGYGSQFASVSADASDEERTKDRRIAIRFERQE